MRFDFNILSLATAGQRSAGTMIAPLLNRFLPEIDAARALLLYFKGTRLKNGVSHDQALGPPERAYSRVTRRRGAIDGKLPRLVAPATVELVAGLRSWSKRARASDPRQIR